MRWLFVVFVIVLAGCSKPGPPYSPVDALKTFRIQPGYRLELFAAEPDIVDPVDMEVDEFGRIYVVTDSGYPLDTARQGTVRLLEDSNGDGRPNRSTVFVDGLSFPTGVMRWKKGILVTDAPNVWYFEDTNGDGKADIRRIVLTGFAFTNPQHTVSNPVYGLDNWICLAHEPPVNAVIFGDKFGDRGGSIRFPDRPDVNSPTVRGRCIRFRPDTYQLEARSGVSQFGHAFDEWGHYFTINNSNHLRHEVIAERYLERNPNLPALGVMANVSDHGNAAEVYPITKNPRFEMLSGVGAMTSACGLTLFQGASYVAEPVYNLVHKDLWSNADATFVARRAYQHSEFLASTDAWFRPVNFYVGPDGALYLLDYYRYSIEHPEWMATETYNSPDLYKGSDRGRIYRIVPEGGAPLLKEIRLGDASAEELVSRLGDPNPWWRRNAQRLLVDRKGDRAVPALLRLAKESPSALARLHALWTLEGLGKLDDRLVEGALGDREPGVRENAIILAEPRLSDNPALTEKLLALVGDPNPKVKFQLLCTLGFVDSSAARAGRERLLRENIEDPWTQLAALSASSEEAVRLYEMAVSPRSGLLSNKTEGRAGFIRLAASVIGARQQVREIRSVLETAVNASAANSAWWRAAALEGIAQGLRTVQRSAETPFGQEVVLKVFNEDQPELRQAALEIFEVAGLPASAAVTRAIRQAAAVAADSSAAPDWRADSLGLLALAGPKPDAATLRKLVAPDQPDTVQAAAVHALGQISGDDVGKFLLARWRNFTGPVRSEAADALLRETGRSRLLLAAIRDETVQPWQLSFRQKSRLLMNRDPQLRESARSLLEPKAGEREQVLKRYQAAVDQRADPARGEAVFKRICAKCHKLNGVGADVGPDLATVRNRSKQMLLEDLLMPSKSIAQDYESYVVETDSGAMIEGVMGPQTPATITLRHEDGQQDVIQRSNIKSLRVTNLSAMPSDLDQQISVSEMADLLQFLVTAR